MLKLLAILLVCLSAQSLNALTVGNCVESPVLNDFDASKVRKIKLFKQNSRKF